MPSAGEDVILGGDLNAAAAKYDRRLNKLEKRDTWIHALTTVLMSFGFIDGPGRRFQKHYGDKLVASYFHQKFANSRIDSWWSSPSLANNKFFAACLNKPGFHHKATHGT